MTLSLPVMLTAAGVLAAVFGFGAGSGAVRAGEIDAGGLYDLPAADVVFLGEVHDNPLHHAHQAIAVEAIGAKALVFEMLRDDQARRATPEQRGSAPALGALLEWEAGGWPDFDDYYPIFVANPEALIFVAALDRHRVRRAVTEGAAAVFGASATLFGLDRQLDVEEAESREALQMAAHCDALPEDLLPGMVEAQRLRDAALARAVVEALAVTGGPVAVITGNGHARTDWGVPRYLRQAAPDVSILSIGQVESVPVDPPPYDLWLVTDPALREDPCAAFRR